MRVDEPRPDTPVIVLMFAKMFAKMLENRGNLLSNLEDESPFTSPPAPEAMRGDRAAGFKKQVTSNYEPYKRRRG
jgi:hypothetical protein